MMSTKRIGQIMGVLFLVQMAGSIAVNFFLTAPLFGDPGFVVAAAGSSTQIGISALIGLVSSGLSVVIAILAFQVFKTHSQMLAMLLVAISVAGLAQAAVEQMNVMSMVSFSQAHAEAEPAQRETLEAVRVVVASSRNWAHYTGLIVSGCMIFVLYLVFFRFALVPRVLGAAGLVSVVLQLSAVSMPFLGRDVILPLIAPLGLTQIALSLWLIAKGLKETSVDLENRDSPSLDGL